MKRLYYLPTYKNEQRSIMKMPYVTNKGFRVKTTPLRPRMYDCNFPPPSEFVQYYVTNSVNAPSEYRSSRSVRFQSVILTYVHSCTFHVHSSTGIQSFYMIRSIWQYKPLPPPKIRERRKIKKVLYVLIGLVYFVGLNLPNGSRHVLLEVI